MKERRGEINKWEVAIVRWGIDTFVPTFSLKNKNNSLIRIYLYWNLHQKFELTHNWRVEHTEEEKKEEGHCQIISRKTFPPFFFERAAKKFTNNGFFVACQEYLFSV